MKFVLGKRRGARGRTVAVYVVRKRLVYDFVENKACVRSLGQGGLMRAWRAAGSVGPGERNQSKWLNRQHHAL